MSNKSSCRMVFWNIKHGGGGRADGIAAQILAWQPDIVALAEFRGTAPSQSIAGRLRDAGYVHQLSTVNFDEPRWNAVFLASRFKLNHVAHSLPEVPYGNLYWLLANVETAPAIHIGVVHAPWSIYLGRLEYYAALVETARMWRLGPALFIGDTNTGITGADEETEDSACYHEKVTKPLEKEGWRDMFRRFHPDSDAPTWYSPSGKGRRLDQAFANAELQGQVTSCENDWGNSDKYGKLSDHAAILLDLELEAGQQG